MMICVVLLHSMVVVGGGDKGNARENLRWMDW